MTDKERFEELLTSFGIKYDSFVEKSVGEPYNRVTLEGSLDGDVEFAFALNGKYEWFAGSE